MASLWAALQEWFLQVLSSLGFRNKSGTVVVIGLDNAGKTTLLHRAITDKVYVWMCVVYYLFSFAWACTDVRAHINVFHLFLHAHYALSRF